MAESPTDQNTSSAVTPESVNERSVPALKTWHILAVVLAATFAAYARTLSFEFVYDDTLQIVKNPLVHAWRYVPRYFTEDAWAGVTHGAVGSYYRPVFVLWSRVNDAFFGVQAPFFWHLTTIGAHLAVTALVYFLALRLLRDRLTGGIAALVFGLHPVHIEGVAWISGVTEPLVAVFFIAAFLSYLKWRDARGRGGGWLALSLLLFALGMLEKETGVMLPVMIAAYEWVYAEVEAGKPWWKKWLRRAFHTARPTLPFVLLWIPYLIARVAALKGFSHPPSGNLPVSHVLYTWPSLIWFWIHHLIAPLGLASFYDMRPVDHPGLMNFWLPGIAVVATVVAVAWVARRSRVAVFASLWLIVPLAPVLDIRNFSRFEFTYDRYLYLPSVGLAILLAMAIRAIRPGKIVWRGFPATQLAATAGLAVLLGLGTVVQCAYLRNNGVFYKYGFLMAPNNPLVKLNYAAYLGDHGRYAESANLLKRLVLELPDNFGVNYNLGRDCYKLGQLPEAVFYLQRAAAIEPNQPAPFLGLGLAWLRMKDYDKSEAAFRQAIELQPDGFGFHLALGLVLRERGRTAEALEQFKLELANNPDDMVARGEIAKINRQGSNGKN